MDTSTLTAPVVTAVDTPSDRCRMCDHPASDHDPLATRFCAATASGTLSRGCICR